VLHHFDAIHDKLGVHRTPFRFGHLPKTTAAVRQIAATPQLRHAKLAPSRAMRWLVVFTNPAGQLSCFICDLYTIGDRSGLCGQAFGQVKMILIQVANRCASRQFSVIPRELPMQLDALVFDHCPLRRIGMSGDVNLLFMTI